MEGQDREIVRIREGMCHCQDVMIDTVSEESEEPLAGDVASTPSMSASETARRMIHEAEEAAAEAEIQAHVARMAEAMEEDDGGVIEGEVAVL